MCCSLERFKREAARNVQSLEASLADCDASQADLDCGPLYIPILIPLVPNRHHLRGSASDSSSEADDPDPGGGRASDGAGGDGPSGAGARRRRRREARSRGGRGGRPRRAEPATEGAGGGGDGGDGDGGGGDGGAGAGGGGGGGGDGDGGAGDGGGGAGGGGGDAGGLPALVSRLQHTVGRVARRQAQRDVRASAAERLVSVQEALATKCVFYPQGVTLMRKFGSLDHGGGGSSSEGGGHGGGGGGGGGGAGPGSLGGPEAPGDGARLAPGEVLVSVTVMRQGRFDNRRTMAELQLPGSFTLRQLRDAVHCYSDTAARSAGCFVQVALFEIGPGFYSVSAPAPPADADAGDTTHVIPGDDVRLSQLPLRVSNRPTYYFHHQRGCTHQWCVSDVRLAHPQDPQLLSSYPRVVYSSGPPRRMRCAICRTLSPERVLGGHPHAPADPCLLCRSCTRVLLGPEAAAQADAPGGGSARGVAGGSHWQLYSLT